ncbi:MAG: hypothetical protein M3O15_02410 [Acidobacteriota bacterium]|nr:hypothetical protein [Acidobacteriota bacterium]
MNKFHASGEMTHLNGAAFRIGAGVVREGQLELLLDAALDRIFGGQDGGPAVVSTCTTFNCNLYAPPPAGVAQ